MESTTVKKSDLIKKLTDNREAHHAIYLEALEGYQSKVIAAIDKFKERVLAGEVLAVVINLPKPEDHTRDYDRVLLQCEMEVAEELVLTDREFQTYVMDDWNWQRQFLASNAGYSQTATAMLAASG